MVNDDGHPATRVVESILPLVGPRRERGRLAVVDRGLVWNGESLFEGRHLVSAYVVPPMGEAPAKLHVLPRRRAEHVFELRLADGREILAALELDATRSIIEFRIAPLSKTWPTIGSVLFGLPILCIVGVVVAPSALKLGFALGILLSLVALFCAAFSSTVVRVGADAIDVRWMFFYGRRIALKNVRGVVRTAVGVRLDFVSGGAFELRTGEEPVRRSRGLIADAIAEQQERRMAFDRELLFERIEQAQRAFRLAAPMPFDAVVLDPAGRDVDAWIADLRALGDRPVEDYRGVVADVEKLWEIVVDPRAAPARRAAALLACAPTLDEGRERELQTMSRALLDAELCQAIEATLRRDESAMRAAMSVYARRG